MVAPLYPAPPVRMSVDRCRVIWPHPSRVIRAAETPTARKRVDTAPAAGDIEQLQMANGAGQGGVDRQVLADRLQASIVRSSSSGAPVDQACGLHAVGYWTGYLVIERG